MKYISFKDTEISTCGIGTTGLWFNEDAGINNVIHKAFYDYGVNVIDTAEMYGQSEHNLGKILSDMPRDQIFLMDKILPSSCTQGSFERSLDRSLQRLHTSYIDLYLLHWRENTDLSFLAKAMNQAVQAGKIRYWGVSNFDVKDINDLMKVPGGNACSANQILYNVLNRGIEYDLLPLLHKHHILPVSYSSLDISYHSRQRFTKHKAVVSETKKEGITPEALMLAFNTRHNDLCALFSTSSEKHLDDDMQYLNVQAEDYKEMIDHYFPKPVHKIPLVKY